MLVCVTCMVPVHFPGHLTKTQYPGPALPATEIQVDEHPANEVVLDEVFYNAAAWAECLKMAITS